MQVKNAASQQSSVSVYSLLVFASSYPLSVSLFVCVCVCYGEKTVVEEAFYWRCKAEFLSKSLLTSCILEQSHQQTIAKT